MATLLTVTFPSLSGLPEDDVTHSYAIAGLDEDDPSEDFDAVADAVNSIYNQTKGSTVAGDLAEVMSLTRTRATDACVVRFYDVTAHLDGSPHGSPYAVRTFTLDAAAGGSVSLPDEVAIVATLEAANRADQVVEAPDGADIGSLVDRPRQRYTGRVYLGPWTTNAIRNVSPFDRPSDITMERIRLAMKEFAEDLEAINATYVLSVWSRQDQVMRRVDAVSTDNAWDTQRRRGNAPSARVRLEFVL